MHRIVSSALAALVVAVVLLPSSAGQAGGGLISNTLPTVLTFTSAGGASQTRLTSDIFSGTVRDLNTEARIARITVTFTTFPVGASPTSFTRDIVAGDLLVTSEPGSFTSGWKVWNTGGADGVLSFKFQTTWTVAGGYVVRALVRDQAATDQFGPASDISITITDGFTVAADPVLASGAANTGVNWGNWASLPGGTNVDSANYVKVTNSGTNAAQSFTVDFTPSVFTGADAVTTIALNSNIKFDCQEGTSSQVPQDLTFDLAGASASASGSVTKSFTGLGNIIYCTYRIVAIQSPLLDQAYTAAYTVS